MRNCSGGCCWPSLLRVAGEAAPKLSSVEEMSTTVEEALATAESAGYRVDTLLGPVNEAAVEAETTDGETEPPQEEMQTTPVAEADHDEPK